ncbi:MAG TPA: hypothetical protein P5307_16730 [Pirellulaceae bacterium]|nr:hypothetical protein [Pirellulaceae bacterium]
MNRSAKLIASCLIGICLGNWSIAIGQEVTPRAWAANVIVPQCYRSSATSA